MNLTPLCESLDEDAVEWCKEYGWIHYFNDERDPFDWYEESLGG